MTPAIGTDCDVVLFHPQVDSTGFGCLLERGRSACGEVNVSRTAFMQADGSFLDSQVVTLTVLLGDGLANPDGSVHATGRAEGYARLFAILNARAGIGVISPEGVYSGLYANGHYAFEDHNRRVSRVTLQLSSQGAVFAPADRDRFEQSQWVDGDTYAGSMGWQNSYWRA